MNGDIIYPSLLIILGVLLASVVIIILTRFFKFISWFAGLIIFLIFSRLALRMWGLDFTTKLIEDVIRASPKYVLALLIILCGFYVSRIIKEKSKDYSFEFKNRMLLVIDFIVHMTFIFTALYSIGVNMLFFLEFYKVILWIIGAIIVLIISMTIGIPLGISIYEKMKKEKRASKKAK